MVKKKIVKVSTNLKLPLCSRNEHRTFILIFHDYVKGGAMCVPFALLTPMTPVSYHFFVVFILSILLTEFISRA